MLGTKHRADMSASRSTICWRTVPGKQSARSDPLQGLHVPMPRIGPGLTNATWQLVLRNRRDIG